MLLTQFQILYKNTIDYIDGYYNYKNVSLYKRDRVETVNTSLKHSEFNTSGGYRHFHTTIKLKVWSLPNHQTIQ